MRVCAVKFKLSKISGSDDLLKGLHRLLFNRDGTVSVNGGLYTPAYRHLVVCHQVVHRGVVVMWVQMVRTNRSPQQHMW